jgi:hypothetical protein
VPGYEASAWQGLLASTNIPAEIVQRLNKELNAALGEPEITSRFADLGLTLLPTSQAEFEAFIAAETRKGGEDRRHQGRLIDSDVNDGFGSSSTVTMPRRRRLVCLRQRKTSAAGGMAAWRPR